MNLIAVNRRPCCGADDRYRANFDTCRLKLVLAGHVAAIDDRTDEPVQNFEYYLATQSETAQSGVTDDDGRTLLIHSDIAEAAMLKARQTKIMIG